jgi:hypothetical protein
MASRRTFRGKIDPASKFYMPAALPDVKVIFLAATEKATPAERAAYLKSFART